MPNPNKDPAGWATKDGGWVKTDLLRRCEAEVDELHQAQVEGLMRDYAAALGEIAVLKIKLARKVRLARKIKRRYSWSAVPHTQQTTENEDG